MVTPPQKLTLMVAGLPVTFEPTAAVPGCRPPQVPKAKPGPCKGFRVPPSARKPRKAPFAITGGPQVVPALEFERTVPQARRLYRGVNSAAGAAATRRGELGSGDFGRGVYTGTHIGVGQVHASGTPQGVVMRLALKPGAKVRKPPERVRLGSSRRIEEWAAENGVDVVDVGYRVVRNPAALIIDGRDYTVRESVVLDYLHQGYRMVEGYDTEIETLRRDLGIDIPDGGQLPEDRRSRRRD